MIPVAACFVGVVATGPGWTCSCRTAVLTGALQPPAVEIQLYQCAFGLGLVYDRLVMTAENRYGGGYNITPTMMLTLVEAALGYQQVHCDGSSWAYRRDVEFKTL